MHSVCWAFFLDGERECVQISLVHIHKKALGTKKWYCNATLERQAGDEWDGRDGRSFVRSNGGREVRPWLKLLRSCDYVIRK